MDSLYTPPTYRDDMRLTKMIPLLNERVNLALMFEAFNISNTWSPTALTTQQYTEAKGILTPTPTAYGVGSGGWWIPGRYASAETANQRTNYVLENRGAVSGPHQ